MRKKLLGALLTMAIALGLFAGLPSVAEAAGKGVTRLTAGKAVTTKLTGSKKHRVKYTESGVDLPSYKMTLYVDGKAAYSYKNANMPVYGARVWLLKVSAGTTLVYVSFVTEDEETLVNKVFHYAGGKLKQSGGIGDVVHAAPTPLSAGQNKFTIRCAQQHPSVGCYTIKASYKYSASTKKVSKASDTYNVIFWNYEAEAGEPGGWEANWGTACKGFKTYTKAGGSALSFSVKKGDRLRVQKVKITGSAVYFQVKSRKGKTGWYKDPKQWNGYFMEAFYAG